MNDDERFAANLCFWWVCKPDDEYQLGMEWSAGSLGLYLGTLHSTLLIIIINIILPCIILPCSCMFQPLLHTCRPSKDAATPGARYGPFCVYFPPPCDWSYNPCKPNPDNKEWFERWLERMQLTEFSLDYPMPTA
jgi:hypothetical protein